MPDKPKQVNKQLKEVYDKPQMNSGLRMSIGLLVLYFVPVLFYYITKQIGIELNPLFFALLFYIYIGLLIVTFKDEMRIVILLVALALGIMLFLYVIFLWFFGLPIPYSNKVITDDMMNVLLTGILVFATIANLVIYRRSAGLERLPNLELELQKNLYIRVENTDNHIARDIKVLVKVLKTKEKESDFWKRIKFNLWKEFTAKEFRKGHILPKDYKMINLKEYFEEELGVKIDKFNNDSGDTIIQLNKEVKREKKFLVALNITYKSDTLERLPFPITLFYELSLKGKEIHIQRKR